MSQISKLIAAAALAVAAACTPGLAQDKLATLNDNDGLVVDKGSFTVVKGNGAKANPLATLKRMGAREVSDSAIIYRSGNKLYIVDGKLPSKMPKQYSSSLKEWCPTCHWYVPQTYMR
jgi:hypothetical protein